MSLVIVILILYSTYRLLSEAVHGLLAGVPPGLSLETIWKDMASMEGVISVHDLHVWSLTSNNVALSAHVVVSDFREWDVVLSALRTRLAQFYGIEHITLQPETDNNFVTFKG